MNPQETYHRPRQETDHPLSARSREVERESRAEAAMRARMSRRISRAESETTIVRKWNEWLSARPLASVLFALAGGFATGALAGMARHRSW